MAKTITYVTLMVSEEIAATTDVADTYTPANGAEVWVESFHGNAAFTTNSMVGVFWDYNAAGESVVWSTKGTDKLDAPMEITGANGTKKVALLCSNGEAGALILSGCVRLKVIT